MRFIPRAFEGFVAAEILKSQVNSGARKEIYHFRDQQGMEVDFVAPSRDGKLWIIECKATKTVQPSMAKRLLALRRAMQSKAGRAVVVHRWAEGAPSTHTLAPHAEAMEVHTLIRTLSGMKTRTSRRRLS